MMYRENHFNPYPRKSYMWAMPVSMLAVLTIAFFTTFGVPEVPEVEVTALSMLEGLF